MHSTLVNVLLAQTGEGIKECELIHWHVKVTSSPNSPSQKGHELNLYSSGFCEAA